MPSLNPDEYVSRAGLKLAHALKTFSINPTGWVCADLGSNVGGFVECLLRHGASKVFAVERGYGVVDYRLRTDPRVVVMERTDARSVRLPEPVDLVTIDAGWTRQEQILPHAATLLKPDGRIITLVKPHYESPQEWLKNGVLPDAKLAQILGQLRSRLPELGYQLDSDAESPIRGDAGNQEFLWLLKCSKPAVVLERNK